MQGNLTAKNARSSNTFRPERNFANKISAKFSRSRPTGTAPSCRSGAWQTMEESGKRQSDKSDALDAGDKISSPFGPLSVRKDTMWEARLVLSTLDPAGPWAGPLRAAIRSGNRPEVDRILASVYAARESDVGAAPDSAQPLSSRPVAKCTVLPPSPSRRGRISA